MLLTCKKSNLRIFEFEDSTFGLANGIPCSELEAMVLQMQMQMQQVFKPLDWDSCSSLNWARSWLKPEFESLMASLDLGKGSAAARDLWNSHSSLGNVLVYGDYDTDGIASTVLAMEIFRNKAAQVRYFIPRRDTQGYGLNANVVKRLVSSACNTLVVVDCGTNDSDLLSSLAKHGINIFVFDHHHHTASQIPTYPTIVNPCLALEERTGVSGSDTTTGSPEGNDKVAKLCATAVLWCWAWKEKIVSQNWLKYAMDLVSLATISDCMPLNNLNRLLVRQGLRLMQTNPRRGLGALMNRLNIDRRQLSEEQLSMRVIPCLNAPGRLSCADPSVRALLGMGNDHDVYECADNLVKANRRRQQISERISERIRSEGPLERHVIYDESWPVGVLSGVASRICSQSRSPVVLAAPAAGKVRGTLRVPSGGNAVGILSEISPLLDAWGGHRYAAGFSVLKQNWDTVASKLENLLSQTSTQLEEEVVPVISLPPAWISLRDWQSVMKLGPFGNDNPCPRFYCEHNFDDRIEPLGHDGKHCTIRVDNAKLLAFNSADELQDTDLSHIQGWVYHPRVDYWRNEELIQFVLEYAVL